MKEAIPAAILDYLSNLIIKSKAFAYLLLTKDGNLLTWGGDLSTYGISNLQVGELACNQVILLEGLLPLGDEAVVLPCADIEQKNCADIHIFPGHECDWMLLLDASRERDRYQTMQQKGNDLSLLRDQQAKIINQYFGKEVKDNLAQGLLALNEQGERREITILAVKLCDLTAYSENNSPEQTFKTLNLYLSPIVESILDEAGMIDKVIVDTVISFFGILSSTGHPPMSAIAAAFQMLEFSQEVNLRQPSNPLDIAISITSGYVSLGLIGSKSSKSFFAIGQSIDLLTQLKNQSRPREILIDENTFTKINDLQKHFIESIVTKPVFSAPVKTYFCRTR